MLTRTQYEDLARDLAPVLGESQGEQRDDIPSANGPEDYGLAAEPAGEAAQDRPKGTDVLPFETFNAADWQGVEIEPRRWIVSGRIPAAEPGIMSGDGGTGKTKLGLQLAAAIPAGLRDWIGFVVDAEGPTIVFSAEEKLKEMHRRTHDVIEHRGLSFSDLHHGLHFICDQEDPVLGAIDRNGIVQPTMALFRLEKTIAAVRPAFVMIENAADVYGGNENDRTNVSRFVRHVLGRLTAACDSTIMLIQHPSVSGLSDGTGRSGSTGWNNSGRWRCNFTKLRDDLDKNVRQLEIIKNNYGPDGEKVRLRWDRGVFVPEGQGNPLERNAAERKVDELFLRLLAERNAQGRWVTPSRAVGSAPKELAAMPGADGCRPEAFANAMERLLAAGQITVERYGSNSKQRQRVVISDFQPASN